MADDGDSEIVKTEGHILPAVARARVEEALIGQAAGGDVAAEGYLSLSRGVFVTIWNEERGLRGCKGTITACRENLIEETRYNALSAAFDDHRCPPVTGDELELLRFEVSVLGDLEAVREFGELDPALFGVVVSSADGRRGLLLPGVRGIETVEAQLSTARRKAGIEEGERVDLMRFRIEKFCEER